MLFYFLAICLFVNYFLPSSLIGFRRECQPFCIQYILFVISVGFRFAATQKGVKLLILVDVDF